VQPELAARVPALRYATAIVLGLGAITAVAIVVQAVALADLVDRSLLHHDSLNTVRPELIVLGGTVVARAVLTYVGEWVATRTAASVVTVLRRQLVAHALALGPQWLAGERPGELSLTATRGLHSLHAYFQRYLPQAAMAAVVPIMLLAWVATQDWLSLLVALALVAAIPVTMIYFGREATKRTERQWRRLGSLAGRFLQLIEGLPTLRAFGREEQGRREVMASTESVRVATMRTLRVAFLSALSMDLIAGFGVGFVAMVLGLRLLWGELSLQTAMAVLLVAPEIFIPLRRAGAEFHASTEGQAAADRVLEVLSLPAPSSQSSAMTATGGPPARRAAALRISQLHVEYADRSTAALAGFSLDVPAGTRVALVGPSGSGKSTVLAAVLGFVNPTSGTMRVDGVAASDMALADWRSQFSWLPQRPYLFTASLAENVRLGHGTASAAALDDIIDAVGLRELVSHLPQGVDTLLGPDGLTLSAGERQRVALARALLRPAPILLLDEPTSSLDPDTAAQVAEAIEPWLAERTVVVAAHEPVLLHGFDAVVQVAASAVAPS
jgi:thiol reductant ABC exporter CydD subunit